MALGGTSSGKEENGQDTKEKGVPMEIYYLRELNGRVMVYREDKNTLFEPTQILLSSLPKELQKEIAEGKYLPSKEALYSFLENYSS